jgi:D-alanyl-D-alanine carboxypeptidase (penicillin-binding protein 5/6)
MDHQSMPLRIFLISLLLTLSGIAAAQNIIPEPPSIDATGYLLIDADTERVLAGTEVDATLPPASLTKIMTSFVAAGELAAGRISITDEVPISVAAWRTPGSRMFIREGTTVALGELLKGIVIQSGNDASVAVAEYIAGSETAFADMMNQQAQALGMHASQFQNATGLPDEGHYTSVRDLATLTRALINRYPDHYATYAERSFTFNDIEQPNRNRLLWRDRTVDGVKTGHTEAAGYCLVASALRDGMRLIAVVMGTTSDEARMRETQKLLKYGFRYFQTQKLYDADVALKQSEVWFGASDTVQLGVSDLVYVTIPRGRYDDLKATTDVERVIKAPLEQGQELGSLRVTLDDEVVFEAPLVVLEAVPEAGFFKRLWHAVYLFFSGLFG